MSLTINSNIQSLQIDKQISQKSSQVKDSIERLSSGKSINKPSDNPAGLAVALALLATADTSAVAARNISDGVSVANIADGAVSTAQDVTTRLAELSTQAANGTLSDDQRAALNNEFQALTSELDRISQTTSFNGQSLLAADSSVTIQAGTTGSEQSRVSLGLPGVSSASLGLSGADISTAEGARTALESVKAAQDTLAQARGEIGAGVSRLETAFNVLQTSEVNQRESASRILDVDVAKESSNLVANRIQLEAAVAVKGQANTLPSIAQLLLS